MLNFNSSALDYTIINSWKSHILAISILKTFEKDWPPSGTARLSFWANLKIRHRRRKKLSRNLNKALQIRWRGRSGSWYIHLWRPALETHICNRAANLFQAGWTPQPSRWPKRTWSSKIATWRIKTNSWTAICKNGKTTINLKRKGQKTWKIISNLPPHCTINFSIRSFKMNIQSSTWSNFSLTIWRPTSRYTRKLAQANYKKCWSCFNLNSIYDCPFSREDRTKILSIANCSTWGINWTRWLKQTSSTRKSNLTRIGWSTLWRNNWPWRAKKTRPTLKR